MATVVATEACMLSQNGELEPSEDEDEVEAALYDKMNVSLESRGMN